MTDSDIRRRSDDNSWQRSDLRTGGRYAGRNYYDRKLTEPGEDLPTPAPPGAAGRAIRVIGLVLLFAGIAGWLWLLLALVSSFGDGILPDDPFGTRVTGVPLGSGGFILILVGGALAAIGHWMDRAARRVTWVDVDPD
ncbi:MAG TPA: hypothetical protein VFV67_06685 [Actinophytocola sp.]|uniref:hypothetical protein n=1 Tax=Actinophytocola sp. TaxID=1872138 RepID=UPI002DBFB8FA|nr:hypothetical protein [Actinophytocola sp.]HEU5470321.1 hypothetical protein [Actinophytocola sp.]